MVNEIKPMPKEYQGEIYYDSHNGSYSRKWTAEEIKWMESLIEEGYTNTEIAQSMGRGVTSVSTKRKKLGKKNRNYNKRHYREKTKLNKHFLKVVNPVTILDLYNGGSELYKNYDSTTNDIDNQFNTDYHKDAFKLLCELYSQDKRYDLIDIDPFGSAYDCFDLAIKMSNKALCVTFGELGHKRWKRLDYVNRFYGIHSLEDFTLDALISEIKRIGLRNKKKLKVHYKRDWGWVGRVWFIIEPITIKYRGESNGGF